MGPNEFDARDVYYKLLDFIKDFFKDKEGPAVVGISGGN